MAAKQLLPGYGSKYISEVMAAADAGTIGVDTIDTSRCAAFAVQVTATTGLSAGSTFQVQQTFDGSHWADLGSAIPIVLGAVSRFGAFSGPYGVVRLKLNESDTGDSDSEAGETENAQFVVVGFELQGKS